MPPEQAERFGVRASAARRRCAAAAEADEPAPRGRFQAEAEERDSAMPREVATRCLVRRRLMRRGEAAAPRFAEEVFLSPPCRGPPRDARPDKRAKIDAAFRRLKQTALRAFPSSHQER